MESGGNASGPYRLTSNNSTRIFKINLSVSGIRFIIIIIINITGGGKNLIFTLYIYVNKIKLAPPGQGFSGSLVVYKKQKLFYYFLALSNQDIQESLCVLRSAHGYTSRDARVAWGAFIVPKYPGYLP